MSSTSSTTFSPGLSGGAQPASHRIVDGLSGKPVPGFPCHLGNLCFSIVRLLPTGQQRGEGNRVSVFPVVPEYLCLCLSLPISGIQASHAPGQGCKQQGKGGMGGNCSRGGRYEMMRPRAYIHHSMKTRDRAEVTMQKLSYSMYRGYRELSTDNPILQSKSTPVLYVCMQATRAQHTGKKIGRRKK